MSTFTQILYHIVFSTKNRDRAIDPERKKELFQYIWGVLKKHDCHLYRIGGDADHIHILCALHPGVALAHLIKDIKVSTSDWIKHEKVFPFFSHWQEGYGAFTHCFHEKERLIDYLKNQENHHARISFTDELLTLLKEAGIVFDDRYLK